MSLLINNTKTEEELFPIFARHDTFHPRYGWLKKGFDKASEDNDIFHRDDAPIILGVGKNMAKAIRYWCKAFKILEDVSQDGLTWKHTIPSKFGQMLLGPEGWDQYLEDSASLWILHWRLLRMPCYAPAWYFAFNVFGRTEFTIEELIDSLVDYKQLKFTQVKISTSSLRKDVNCLIRMYVEQNNPSSVIEETIDSPFTELGLIKNSISSKLFHFNVGGKSNLPDEIIVFACMEFAENMNREANSISLSRLLYDTGSPGLAFKLNQSSLYDAIERISSKFKSISIQDTAGIIQLHYDCDAGIIAKELLDQYYKHSCMSKGKS